MVSPIKDNQKLLKLNIYLCTYWLAGGNILTSK